MILVPGTNYEMEIFKSLKLKWLAIMGNNPSHSQGDGNRPVEMVSWDEVQEFITQLNQKTGRQYRLPTEAEWEYACNGGSPTEYCGSNEINAVA